MNHHPIVTKWSKVASVGAAIAASESAIERMRRVKDALQRGVVDTIELAAAENALLRAEEYLRQVKP